jgi:hypothetical protein
VNQVLQDLDALQYDIVGLPPFDIRDEADAAAVVLVLRPVKALRGRQSPEWILLLHFSETILNTMPLRRCKASQTGSYPPYFLGDLQKPAETNDQPTRRLRRLDASDQFYLNREDPKLPIDFPVRPYRKI